MKPSQRLPWSRIGLFSIILASLFGLALYILTGDELITVVLIAIQFVLFFAIVVIAFWWEARRMG